MELETVLARLAKKRWQPTELHPLVKKLASDGHDIKVVYDQVTSSYPWYRLLKVHGALVLLPRQSAGGEPVVECDLLPENQSADKLKKIIHTLTTLLDQSQ